MGILEGLGSSLDEFMSAAESDLKEAKAKVAARRGRSYYRHVKTGDRAYLTEVNGVTMVQLDRPNEEIVRKFVAEEWIPDDDNRPLTRAQVAMCIKEFDSKLCHFLGHVKLSKQKWADMPEKERVAWIRGVGPKQKPAIRQMAYRVLWNLMQEHTKDG